jgi:hypothetical protein
MSYIHCEPRPRVIEYTRVRDRGERYGERGIEKRDGGGWRECECERDGKENRDGEKTDEIHMGMKNQGRIVEFGLVYMCEAKKNKQKNRKRPKKDKRNMRT